MLQPLRSLGLLNLMIRIHFGVVFASFLEIPLCLNCQKDLNLGIFEEEYFDLLLLVDLTKVIILVFDADDEENCYSQLNNYQNLV